MRTAIPYAATVLATLTLATGRIEAWPPTNPEFLEATDACTTKIDRSAELVPGEFAVTYVDIGGGLSDVEVSAILTNNEVGSYQYANAIADFSGSGLDVADDPAPTPIGFGEVPPHTTAPSTTSMTLRIPTASVPSLIFQLTAGLIPFRVEARERLVLQPGVFLYAWTSHEDAMAANPTEFPIWTGGPPFDIEDVPDGQRLFIIADVYKPTNIKEEKWFGEYLSATWDDSSHRWNDTWGGGFSDIDEVIVSGTFCGDSGIDDPADGTPVRFNGIDIDGIRLSGQVTGQLLEVTSSLGVRDGDGRWELNVELDASLTAQVSAETTASASGTIDLANLCIPVATIPIGLGAIPVYVSLTQWVGLEGDASAGLVAGFQKHYHGGYQFGFDTRNADPIAWGHPVWEDIPIAFSPPRLTEDTGLTVRASAGLDVGVSVGSGCGAGAAELFVGTEVYGQLAVDPLLDPWWELSAGGSLEGSMELEMLGYTIPLFSIPIVEFPDATTRTGAQPPALLSGGPIPTADAPPALTTPLTSGESDRWAVAIDDLEGSGAYADAEIALLDDGGIVAGAGNLLTRLGPSGEMVWAKRIAPPFGIVKILPNTSTSLRVMLSQFGSTTLAHLDPATGAFQSAVDYRITTTSGSPFTCAVHDMCSDDATPPGALVVGRVSPGGFIDYDICVVKLDAAGNVVWTKILSDAGLQYANAVERTPDGGYAIVGSTDWGPDIYHTGNGLLIKLSENGDLEWARSLVTTHFRGDSLYDVVVRDDGRWYFTGASQGTALDTNGLIVGWVEGDGSAADMRVYAQDEAWEQDAANAAFGPFVPTQGGASPYDAGYSMALAPGGVVIVGRTGTQTGVSEPSASWALEIGDSLGMEWFRTWDGGHQDVLHGVVTGPDGHVAAGAFNSPMPLGTGGEPGLFVMKMPFEGGVAMLPGAGLTGHYIQPEDHGWPRSLTYAPDLYSGGPLLGTPLMTATDGAPVTTTIFSSVLGPDPSVCVRLLTGPGRPSVTDACTDDEDGDAVPAATDLCPDDFDPAQTDSDGDGAGNACDLDDDNDGTTDADDCASLDPATWAIPSAVALETLEIAFEGWDLVWTPPANPGGTTVTFDVVATPHPADWTTAALCDHSGIAETRASLLDHTGWSSVFLEVRARNACGAGPLGTSSAGVPHSGRSCP